MDTGWRRKNHALFNVKSGLSASSDQFARSLLVIPTRKCSNCPSLLHAYFIIFYFSSTQSIHLTSTQTVFNQQQIFIQLLYLKFPDIPNVYSTKTARPLPNSVKIVWILAWIFALKKNSLSWSWMNIWVEWKYMALKLNEYLFVEYEYKYKSLIENIKFLNFATNG